MWLNGNVVTHLRQHVGCNISQFIVWYDREASAIAAYGVLNIKMLSTCANYRESIWLPTVSEAQTVSECHFVEAETMFFNLKDIQPMGDTILMRENHCMFLWFV